jgi:hypothetical protein
MLCRVGAAVGGKCTVLYRETMLDGERQVKKCFVITLHESQ